jgi:hypothetical protein
MRHIITFGEGGTAVPAVQRHALRGAAGSPLRGDVGRSSTSERESIRVPCPNGDPIPAGMPIELDLAIQADKDAASIPKRGPSLKAIRSVRESGI